MERYEIQVDGEGFAQSSDLQAAVRRCRVIQHERPEAVVLLLDHEAEEIVFWHFVEV
jgi:hypothetical protein